MEQGREGRRGGKHITREGRCERRREKLSSLPGASPSCLDEQGDEGSKRETRGAKGSCSRICHRFVNADLGAVWLPWLG